MIGRRNRRRQSARVSRQPLRLLSPRVYLQRHAQVALDSLGRLYRNLLPSVMTAAVIGIALALPSGLYLLLDNLHRLSGSWEGQASISVFLKGEVPAQQAEGLATRIRQWPEVAGLQLITPAQALEEFSAQSGFADALETLEENPLPAVLVVTPRSEHTAPESAAALQQRLRSLPEVDLAQLDLEWVQRLAAMIDMARRGIILIGTLLALAVLLVIGNTIRLEIQNRRAEIVVTKLIGATNAFVRRPFLYSGLWYGLLGALLAWLLVVCSFWLLADPVARLAGLYHSDFELETLPVLSLGALLASGILLGLLGSWLAVGRHLSAIEPT
ncbi:MAG: permease-like cell division protein FtsX [Gammaproteobacteria bacterium]|jgi:cell division transport system permease protein